MQFRIFEEKYVEYFFYPILIQFLRSCHLNGLLMGHKQIAILFRKGVKILTMKYL